MDGWHERPMVHQERRSTGCELWVLLPPFLPEALVDEPASYHEEL